MGVACIPLILAPQRWRQEGHKFKVILSHTTSFLAVLVTGDTVSKEKQR